MTPAEIDRLFDLAEQIVLRAVDAKNAAANDDTVGVLFRCDEIIAAAASVQRTAACHNIAGIIRS